MVVAAALLGNGVTGKHVAHSLTHLAHAPRGGRAVRKVNWTATVARVAGLPGTAVDVGVGEVVVGGL